MDDSRSPDTVFAIVEEVARIGQAGQGNMTSEQSGKQGRLRRDAQNAVEKPPIQPGNQR